MSYFILFGSILENNGGLSLDEFTVWKQKQTDILHLNCKKYSSVLQNSSLCFKWLDSYDIATNSVINKKYRKNCPERIIRGSSTVDSRYLELGYLKFCKVWSVFMNQKYILIAFSNHNLESDTSLHVQITRSAN